MGLINAISKRCKCLEFIIHKFVLNGTNFVSFCILNGFEVVAVWKLDLADGGCSKDRELVQSMNKTETFFFFFFNLNNEN